MGFPEGGKGEVSCELAGDEVELSKSWLYSIGTNVRGQCKHLGVRSAYCGCSRHAPRNLGSVITVGAFGPTSFP